MADIERLQRFLRAAPVAGRDVVTVPPFTIYFDPHDSLRYLNYAIPDDGADPTPAEIDALRQAFRARERLPRLEWVEEAAPHVAAALGAAGFEEELRTPLMACGLDELREPLTDVDPLTVRGVEGASDERDATNLQRVAFGGAALADDEEPRGGGGRMVLARSGSTAVAAASWTAVEDGFSEVVGVATAGPWRRRGLAGVVTAAAARAAFAAGASTCILSPGDEGAMRVYARAGFRRVATMLHWSAPSG